MANINTDALFNIGYGLYVVTTNDENKCNGCIVNTVTQVASDPLRVAVSINKTNYTHEVVKNTGIMNINCLSTKATFAVFEKFGFVSGRDVDKFAGEISRRSENGLRCLDDYANAVISLKVDQYVDLGSHGLFICEVTEAEVIDDYDTMTYSYYQKNVKPKPAATNKGGWECVICGYIHEDENLPADFICPWCNHPATDFKPIG